ncbi:MAG: hypothetical protein BKP49_11355 [Treponema sp. CETP13]|nr:MAG: hypothetical protein BKP49_11355 [Treponema sp. CETP13]
MGGQVITEIGMEFQDNTTDKRALTFVDYLKTKNLFNEKYFFIGEKLSYAVGINLCTKMLSLDKLPTAILCANDTMATAVISQLSNNGYKIPKDISVVGFNNISNAKYLTPPLTTVKIPLIAIAQTCLDLLQSHKDQEIFYPRLTYIPTSMKIRESVRDLRKEKN